MKVFPFVCLFLGSVLAACASVDANKPSPWPTAPAHNAYWTPRLALIDGVEMVLVPAGCFRMGSNEGRRDEQPVHEVCISRPFWLDRTEVTNTQFGSHGAFDGPDHPRENLTWYEARDFCRSRGGRLPSEAEWEYAARGVDGWRYPWGDSLYENRLVFDRNNNNQTAPVLSRPLGASWVGALGMVGNVWEWVNSAYLPYPYQAEDGRESDNPPDPRRVYRGGLGSYIDNAVTASARFRGDPHKRDWFIGFRCVKDIE